VTTIDPNTTEWSRPYWDATREHRLTMQKCDACANWAATPSPRCPHCWGDELTWTEPDLEPRLYSWALHRGRGEEPDRMVALVDVLPGVRLLSNLTLDSEHDELAVDEPLELTWLDLEDGRALHQFRRTNTPTGEHT